MKITFIITGKTTESYLEEGIRIYEKRLKHYITFDQLVIDQPKTMKGTSPEEIRLNEAKLIMRNLRPDDHVILLDDKGPEYSSGEFAALLQRLMNAGVRNCVFISGGPYGFDPEVYRRANDTLSLSMMTFTHQMVRLIFTEQLYRAMTILRNEPYHH
ncbi:MAG TPA: 23S rRNA (pseudouridine(1915)-N(3))-methyltransferase RlmH [Bacteroidales bacterium]|nr:23S rRNA (pseudouridine(1915)-N(3))-methyltransferase RlmH [Bacteroidales bacterium]